MQKTRAMLQSQIDAQRAYCDRLSEELDAKRLELVKQRQELVAMMKEASYFIDRKDPS